MARRDFYDAAGLDADAYGYWRPILFEPEGFPTGARYLKVTFATRAELSRREIRYGGASAPAE